VVPRLGDICVILARGEDGRLEQAAEAALDPEKRAALRGLRDHQQAYARPDGFMRRALEGETVFATELPAIHHHGGVDDDPRRALLLRTLRFRSVIVVPIKTRGEVVGTICFGMADSGRSSTPEDVSLAQALAERAATAIENARLYDEAQRARSAAEEAVRVRDDFLSIAGHELRTPVTALRLQLHALSRANGPEADALLGERLTRIGRSVDRLARLIDQLLDVSRVAAGRLALERSEVELGELVRDVLARHSEQLTREGCEVRLTCAERVAGSWDRPRIEQVFTNLLTNAAKYGRGHPIHVTVEPWGADAARVSVRDHGIGIPEADRARIFDRFERGSAARNFGGLGLGLWIARQVVEAHGGRIFAESPPGEGATFHVELPRGVVPFHLAERVI
jgi:signal transduction histidine kinase